MTLLRNKISPRLLAFVLLTTLLIWIEVAITQSDTFNQHQQVISVGVLIDLVLLTTGLCYWLVARPLQLANSRLIVVALLILRIALFILPENSLLPGHFWPLLLALVEGAALIMAVVRIRTIVQTYRQLRPEMSVELALQGSLTTVFGERIAGFILGEGIMLYYALLGWRLKSDLPAGSKILTTNRQSGQIALTGGVLMVCLIEGTAVHVLLTRWNPTVAFWVTAVSGYGMLFFMAHLIATLKRPSYLTENQLHLRLGIFWRASVPKAAITGVSLIYDKPEKQPGLLNGAFLTAPNVLLTFSEPIVFQGPYGIQKKVQAFSFFIDDRTEFVRLLIESR